MCYARSPTRVWEPLGTARSHSTTSDRGVARRWTPSILKTSKPNGKASLLPRTLVSMRTLSWNSIPCSLPSMMTCPQAVGTQVIRPARRSCAKSPQHLAYFKSLPLPSSMLRKVCLASRSSGSSNSRPSLFWAQRRPCALATNRGCSHIFTRSGARPLRTALLRNRRLHLATRENPNRLSNLAIPCVMLVSTRSTRPSSCQQGLTPRASSVGTSRRLVRSVLCRKQDSQFDEVSLLPLTLRLSRRQNSRSLFATRLPKMPISTDSRSNTASMPTTQNPLTSSATTAVASGMWVSTAHLSRNSALSITASRFSRTRNSALKSALSPRVVPRAAPGRRRAANVRRSTTDSLAVFNNRLSRTAASSGRHRRCHALACTLDDRPTRHGWPRREKKTMTTAMGVTTAAKADTTREFSRHTFSNAKRRRCPPHSHPNTSRQLASSPNVSASSTPSSTSLMPMCRLLCQRTIPCTVWNLRAIVRRSQWEHAFLEHISHTGRRLSFSAS